MCLLYSLFYESCLHPGKVYSLPCSDPTQCRQVTDEPPLVTDDLCPEFCPQCLLTGGLFDSNSGSNSRPILNNENRSIFEGFYLESSLLETFEYKSADRIWERAKNDLTDNLEEDALVTENATDLPHLVAVIARVYELLTSSFWRIVIEFQESPSRFQRLLLIRLHEFLSAAQFQQMAREDYLLESERPIRVTKMMTVVTPEDLGSLVDEEERNGSICTERFGQPNPDGVIGNPVKTQCQHVFCEHCLCTWIVDHDTCPYCRRELLNLNTWSATDDLVAASQEVARAPHPMPDWLCQMLLICQVL
ncbi:hypothetical protein IFR05_009855 [Cadophora sp. M221]|nr:hypothetical protein IFR05_009855 [Cadophora sp. M221]